MRWTSCILCLCLALACGPETGEDDGADGSEGGSTGTTTSTTAGSTASTTTAGTNGTTTVASTDGSESGPSDTGPSDTGETGAVGCENCGADEFCDWAANSCGARWDEGVCAPKPSMCELGPDMCGCDGQIHGGDCLAHEAGVDISNDGGCTTPEGTFPCGPFFCDLASTYCQHSPSDALPSADGWVCNFLPDGCGDTPTCDCLVDEPCARYGCDVVEGGGLLITCPGG